MTSHRSKQRPTIRDVAAVAGVSVTTVSHALNNKGRVDDRTRERIEAAAQRLGYVPNRTAQLLRGARTATIGLLLPSLGRPEGDEEALALDNYMRMTVAAASSAHTHGHALSLIPPLRSANDSLNPNLDGVVVVDPVRADPRLDVFEDVGLPFVTIERDLSRAAFRWHVSLDAVAGVEALIDHFQAQRAGRVLMLAPDADWSYAINAIAAFDAAIGEHSLVGEVVRIPTHGLERSAYEATLRALSSPEPPDAIFALAERFSSGVLRAAASCSRAVPAELLVASGADSYQTRDGDPPITALDMQPELTAHKAIELLIDLLDGEEEVEAPLLVPYPLLVRDSSLRQPAR